MTGTNGTRGVVYYAGMTDAPDIPDEMRIVDARNQFGAVIEKARYFDGITFVTHRGKRVAAIVPADDAEWLIQQREGREGAAD